jgi:hypothetical protein
MSTYDKVVAENLAHMGTGAAEWSAVGITGMVESDAPDGRQMPEFAFPEDYESAPSMYHSGPTADTMCCELCAHPIKNAYWIQNDMRKWVLLVGSECVTHFEGKSGERIVKETVWAANRDMMRQYKDAVRAFKGEWMVKYERSERNAYGNWTQVVRWGWKHNTPKDAMTACVNLEKLTETMEPDEVRNIYNGRLVCEATTNGAITRWMKNNRQIADAFVETMEAATVQKKVQA